jgi:hypothetical protein
MVSISPILCLQLIEFPFLAAKKEHEDLDVDVDASTAGMFLLERLSDSVVIKNNLKS